MFRYARGKLLGRGLADIKALYRSSGTRYGADEEPVKKKR